MGNEAQASDSRDNSSDDADSNPPQRDTASTPPRRGETDSDGTSVEFAKPWVDYNQRDAQSRS